MRRRSVISAGVKRRNGHGGVGGAGKASGAVAGGRAAGAVTAGGAAYCLPCGQCSRAVVGSTAGTLRRSYARANNIARWRSAGICNSTSVQIGSGGPPCKAAPVGRGPTHRRAPNGLGRTRCSHQLNNETEAEPNLTSGWCQGGGAKRCWHMARKRSQETAATPPSSRSNM